MITMDHTKSTNPAITAQERFIAAMKNAQRPLFVYVCSLLGTVSGADDVLQEANLVLWRKMSEFDFERDFLSWAYGIVRFQVMTHLKKLARDRRVLQEHVVTRIAAHGERRQPFSEDHVELLDECLEKLPARQREYLSLRYREGLSVAEIAARMSTTYGTVMVMLSRARSALRRRMQTMLNSV